MGGNIWRSLALWFMGGLANGTGGWKKSVEMLFPSQLLPDSCMAGLHSSVTAAFREGPTGLQLHLLSLTCHECFITADFDRVLLNL